MVLQNIKIKSDSRIKRGRGNEQETLLRKIHPRRKPPRKSQKKTIGIKSEHRKSDGRITKCMIQIEHDHCFIQECLFTILQLRHITGKQTIYDRIMVKLHSFKNFQLLKKFKIIFQSRYFADVCCSIRFHFLFLHLFQKFSAFSRRELVKSRAQVRLKIYAVRNVQETPIQVGNRLQTCFLLDKIYSCFESEEVCC